LESYATKVSQVQRIEAMLRKTKRTDEQYERLVRMHRQTAMLCASLATKLKLVPSSRLDRRTLEEKEVPVT
jgi:hypothetical protein